MLQKRKGSATGRLQTLQAIVLASLFLGLPAYSDQLSHCPDADTCWIKSKDGKEFKIRLFNADAPEKDQPYGPEATQFMNQLLINKTVEVQCRGHSFDRRTCDLFFNGQDVSALLVKAGYAWDYPEFSHGKYSALQAEAKANKRGLWQDPQPTSPYCWRWTGTRNCNNNQQYQP